MTTRRQIITERLLAALGERAQRPDDERSTPALARACATNPSTARKLLCELLEARRVTSTYKRIEHRATRVWWLR